eukprot:Platyproteum_vivax@DN7673_c1_g2_i1.p1
MLLTSAFSFSQKTTWCRILLILLTFLLTHNTVPFLHIFRPTLTLLLLYLSSFVHQLLWRWLHWGGSVAKVAVRWMSTRTAVILMKLGIAVASIRRGLTLRWSCFIGSFLGAAFFRFLRLFWRLLSFPPRDFQQVVSDEVVPLVFPC